MDSPGSGLPPGQGPGPPGISYGGKFHIADLPLLIMLISLVAGGLLILIVLSIIIIYYKCRQKHGNLQEEEEEDKIVDSKRGSTASTMSSVLFALQAKKMFSLYDKDCKNRAAEKEVGEERVTQDGFGDEVAGEELIRSSKPPVTSAGLISLTKHEERDDEQGDITEGSDEMGAGVPQYGRLWFSIVYSEITQKLFIRVIRAKYLKSRDRNFPLGTPFVKVFLLPDEFNLQESRIHENTSAPHFDQTFEFLNIRSELLGLKTVRISVYDIDKRRVRHAHGHVIFSLAGYDVTSVVAIWRDLEPDKHLPSAVICGELKVSLTHESLAQTLMVSLWEGRNMQNSEFFGRNHSIQILLMLGNRIIQSMSTISRPFSSTICYDDDSFVLSIPLEQLKSCSLVILLHTDPLDSLENKDEDGFIERTDLEEGMELGKLVLGLETNSHGTAAAHRQEVISNPRQTTTRWHNLHSSIQIATSP